MIVWGELSPLSIIDAFTVKQIITLIYPYQLLRTMLSDVERFMELRETEIDPMTEMYRTYTRDDLHGLPAERLTAYLTGQQESFLSREIGACHCYQCDTYWFANSFHNDQPCPKCGDNCRKFVRSERMNRIPPWIDIDTYSIYSTGVPRRVASPRRHGGCYDFDDEGEDDYSEEDEGEEDEGEDDINDDELIS